MDPREIYETERNRALEIEFAALEPMQPATTTNEVKMTVCANTGRTACCQVCSLKDTLECGGTN